MLGRLAVAVARGAGVASPAAAVPCRRAASAAAGAAEGNGRSEERVRLMLETKVSPRGTAGALFQEAIDAVRERRASLEQDVAFQQVDTGPITKLKQDELDLTRKIFQRIDPSRDLTSDLSHAGHDIDPYWSPFHKVRELRDQVTSEFDEYARVVSIAEQKRVRIQIKKSLRRNAAVYNPYSADFKKHHERESRDPPPLPFAMPDKHWERTPLQERLNREKITWRDIDIIQHFIADNGYILPRRTTMLSRQQQKHLMKAVKLAQHMALLPYNWKPQDYQAMPLMDPIQWMADRLTDRVKEFGDKRSRAMLQVMMERYPELNYRGFLKHEANRAQEPSSGTADSEKAL